MLSCSHSSRALVVLLLCFAAHPKHAAADASKGYKACIGLHKARQYKKTVSCICRVQQTKHNKPIYVYHLGLNHELASRQSKAPATRRRHREQALLRFREYLASLRPGAPRLGTARRAVARLKGVHKQAWLLLQDAARLPPGTKLRLLGPGLRCEGALKTLRLHCHDRLAKPTTPLERCLWRSATQALHHTRPLELLAGTYQMTLQAPGYIPRSVTLRLVAGKRHTQRLKLRKFASLQVRTAPKQSRLLLKHRDGSTRKASSPHSFTRLSPGQYTLLLQKRGHKPKTLALSLTAGAQGKVWLHLRPKPVLAPRLLLSSALVGGLAVLSLVGGLILGSTALHEHRQAQSFAYQTENWRGRYDQAQSIALAGHIMLIAAGLSGATAIGLLAGGLHIRRQENTQIQP